MRDVDYCRQCGREGERTICSRCEKGRNSGCGTQGRRHNGLPIHRFRVVPDVEPKPDDIDEQVGAAIRKAIGVDAN